MSLLAFLTLAQFTFKADNKNVETVSREFVLTCNEFQVATTADTLSAEAR